MTGLLKSLAAKFIKGHWGRVIPAILKAAGEGDFGPALKSVYWFGEKYATVTGAVLWAIGAGLETVCASSPDFAWSCPASRYVYLAGAALTAVGLVDGGTRAPWPTGTTIPPEVKR